jgi:hypothetical protein
VVVTSKFDGDHHSGRQNEPSALHGLVSCPSKLTSVMYSWCVQSLGQEDLTLLMYKVNLVGNNQQIGWEQVLPGG